MILFLILLLLAAAGVSLYASENNGTHDVTLWQWHWSAVPDWVPVVVTAAVIGGLFALYMLYSGLVHGVRVGSMRRRVTTRESAINQRGQRRRPGQASRRHKRKATRMKPPTILVAIGAPPGSIGAPTGNSLDVRGRRRYPPG